MKKLILILILGLVSLPITGFTANSIDNRPFSTTYEKFAQTSTDPGTPHALAKTSYDWFICNRNSTASNTIGVSWTIGTSIGSAAEVTVNGGECMTIQNFPTNLIVVRSLNNTPTYQLVALEVQ